MKGNTHSYFILYKPFDMVSQFIGTDGSRRLREIDFDFPEGIHAIRSLDSHSEGLLLLTTNKKVTKLLFESKIPHSRTYIVQVLRLKSKRRNRTNLTERCTDSNKRKCRLNSQSMFGGSD